MGDGQVSIDELTNGLHRLRGNARSLDLVALMRDVYGLQRGLEHALGYNNIHFNSETLDSYDRSGLIEVDEGMHNLTTPSFLFTGNREPRKGSSDRSEDADRRRTSRPPRLTSMGSASP